MKNKKELLMAGKTGFVLGAAFLAMSIASVSYADDVRVGVAVDPAVVAVAQDNYVYYPNYQVYYNSHRRQYAYLDGGAWVSRPAPHGVSVAVLRASPSVKMDFHDSPANHHGAMVQKYPKTWAPGRMSEGQKIDDRGPK